MLITNALSYTDSLYLPPLLVGVAYERPYYPPSQRAANFSWRMNAERVSSEAVLVMRRIAAFIANMISAGGCASAGFAEAGALVPPTPVGGAPLQMEAFFLVRLRIYVL